MQIKKRAFTLLRTLLTLTLLCWVGYLAYKEGAIHQIKQVDPFPFLAAIALHGLSFVVLLLRWKVVLGIYHPLSIQFLWKSFYIGLLSNALLPSSVGGDVIRGALLAKSNVPLSSIIICSVLERVVGLIIISMICAATFLFFTDMPEHFVGQFINPAILALIIISIPLSAVILFKPISRWATQKSDTPIARLILQLDQIIKVVSQNTLAIIITCLLTVLSASLIVYCHYLLAVSLHIEIAVSALYLIVLLGFIVAAIPISVGGLGVREGVTIVLLSYFGVPQAQGISLAGLYLIVLLLVKAPAALLLIGQQTKPPTPTPENN